METLLNLLERKISSYLPYGVAVYPVIVPARETTSVLKPTLTDPAREITDVDSPVIRTVSLLKTSNPGVLYADTCLSLSHSNTTPS